MSDIKRISPQEALDLTKNGWTYVDVRTEQEFADGHPAGRVQRPARAHRRPGRWRRTPTS